MEWMGAAQFPGHRLREYIQDRQMPLARNPKSIPAARTSVRSHLIHLDARPSLTEDGRRQIEHGASEPALF